MTSAPTQVMPPAVVLNQMLTASWLAQAISVSAELGVADRLAAGPLTPADLAKLTGSNAGALYRTLRALASAGIFRQNENGQFEQTPLSECLRSDAPGSMRAWARACGAKWFWDMLGELNSCVRRGEKSSFNTWEYFEQNREDGEVFNQAMTSFSASEIGPILANYDFSGIRKLLDLAGGHGSLLAAVLEANPGMEGVLFDAPSVIEGARPLIQASKVAGRCELMAGDFFASVPSGADAIMMKHILHDWDDENSLKILRACHAALPDGGKLLVIDAVIPAGNEPSVGKQLDLVMFLIGGRERTDAEFRALFDAAGFELTRIVATPSPVSVVEGRKR